MEKGRYTVYQKMRLPQRRRGAVLQGSFEDKGRYIRCGNCGFILDTQRDLGNGESAGNYETDMVVEAQPPAGSGAEPILCMDTLGMVGPIIENGPDGDPVTDSYSPRVPQVARGCPLCGASNL